MGQHRLNSLAIIYIEHAYGNQVIVNSMDKIFDIFLQHHGRKNFFFEHGLDNVENVDRIILHIQTFNRAIFPMITVSLDGKMANVGVSNSISTPTLSGKKVTPPAPPTPPPPLPSPKVPITPMWVSCLQKMRDDTSFRSFYEVVLLKSKGCSCMTKENSRAEQKLALDSQHIFWPLNTITGEYILKLLTWWSMLLTNLFS